MKNYLRDPLTHFLVIGALFFLINHWFDPSDGSNSTIRISKQVIDQLDKRWQLQWKRPPSEEETRALIENHIREEVLYREALQLNLAQDDLIIRRRLMQKIEFLLDDTNSMEEPETAALENFYRQHLDQFTRPASYNFSHIYINADKHGKDTLSVAGEWLKQLNTREEILGSDLPQGDSFMPGNRFNGLNGAQIDRTFGQGFADQLATLPLKQWSGPIESGYGLHLVQLTNLQSVSPRNFDDVLPQVNEAYRLDQQQQLKQNAYQELRSRYQVVYERGAL